METEYSLTSVLYDWSTKILQKDKLLSSWSIVPGKNVILFLHDVDSGFEKPSRTIWIGKDMIPQIRCGERVATYPVYDRVTSFSDIYKALQEIPYFNQCGGINGDGNCPQVFYIREPYSSSDRCKNCQLQRKRYRDNDRRRQLRAEQRRIKDQKQMKCLKQKIDRRNIKIQFLKMDMENLQYKTGRTEPDIAPNKNPGDEQSDEVLELGEVLEQKRY